MFSSLFSPNILLSTLYSNTLSLRVCPSLNVGDHVLHPYITGGKIMVLCINITNITNIKIICFYE
jgi:hypothetical protein